VNGPVCKETHSYLVSDVDLMSFGFFILKFESSGFRNVILVKGEGPISEEARTPGFVGCHCGNIGSL
jgi:hypothetical protein